MHTEPVSTPKRRPTRVIIILILLTIVSIAVLWYFLWRIPPANTPEEAVRYYFKAVQTDNERAARAYLDKTTLTALETHKNDSAAPQWSAFYSDLFRKKYQIDSLSVMISNATISGNHAVVPITLVLPSTHANSNLSDSYTTRYYAVKEGSWKVDMVEIRREQEAHRRRIKEEEKVARKHSAKLWDDLVKETAKSRRKP